MKPHALQGKEEEEEANEEKRKMEMKTTAKRKHKALSDCYTNVMLVTIIWTPCVLPNTFGSWKLNFREMR